MLEIKREERREVREGGREEGLSIWAFPLPRPHHARVVKRLGFKFEPRLCHSALGSPFLLCEMEIIR